MSVPLHNKWHGYIFVLKLKPNVGSFCLQGNMSCGAVRVCYMCMPLHMTVGVQAPSQAYMQRQHVIEDGPPCNYNSEHNGDAI